MADVIIKGMEMPKNCIDCMFTTIDYDMCILAKNDLMLCGGRPSWCPLLSLPEGHGRLGDLDALYEVAKTRSMGIYGPCNAQCVITGNDILKALTIVPAEGGNDDD